MINKQTNRQTDKQKLIQTQLLESINSVPNNEMRKTKKKNKIQFDYNG